MRVYEALFLCILNDCLSSAWHPGNQGDGRSILWRATRSLTEPPGLRYSALPWVSSKLCPCVQSHDFMQFTDQDLDAQLIAERVYADQRCIA